MFFGKHYLWMIVIGLVAVMALTSACAAQAPQGPANSGDAQEVEQSGGEEQAVEDESGDADVMEHEADEEHTADEEHVADEEHMADEEHAAEHDGDEEHEHDGEATIPNNGAIVRITAPADGAVFKQGEDIVVEIETENFPLGENGNHWHVYVDDESFGMIVGGDLDQVLRGLEPGEHEISASLSNGEHQELEDGAQITITVE